MKKGKVFLVGAGPGDAQLITVKGVENLRKAEVVLYDRLVNPLLLEEAPAHAEFIYCGKLPDRHILRQELINELLVEKGLEGKIVVRLKGGDPSVFGRVGEEAEVLAKHGVEFEIVPGITSGIAAPAYAGIPVTHRNYGSSFALVTGHDKSVDGKPSIDWRSLAEGIDTMAFYMGVGNLDHITSNLISHGRSPETPVILIQWGTLGRQQTLQGTLATIVEQVERVNFKNPAITLVGDIVELREKIKWFEQQPLVKKQILLARTGEEKGKVAGKLIEQGAEVFEYPRFKTESLVELESCKQVIQSINNYDNLLFVSPESVKFFFEGLRHYKVDIRTVNAQFFGGSSKSKAALESFGCFAKDVSELPEASQLLVIGEERTTKQDLLHLGDFDYLSTHQTAVVEQSLKTLIRLIEDKTLTTILFPSAGAVKKFTNALHVNGFAPLTLFSGLEVICMGETSARAAETVGFQVTKIAKQPTAESLVECLLEDAEQEQVN